MNDQISTTVCLTGNKSWRSAPVPGRPFAAAQPAPPSHLSPALRLIRFGLGVVPKVAITDFQQAKTILFWILNRSILSTYSESRLESRVEVLTACSALMIGLQHALS